jgi:hypothetical protein
VSGGGDAVAFGFDSVDDVCLVHVPAFAYDPHDAFGGVDRDVAPCEACDDFGCVVHFGFLSLVDISMVTHLPHQHNTKHKLFPNFFSA